MLKRILITVTLSSVLTACGGGGGGGGASTTPSGGVVTEPTKSSTSSQESVSITLDKSSVTMDESSTATVSVNTGSVSDAAFTVTASDPALSGAVANGVLTITSANVEKASDVVVTVTAQKGSASASAKVTVHVDNTSAKSLVEQVSSIVAQKTALSTLSEEATVFKFVSDLAFKSAYATRSETKGSSAAFKALTDSASAEIATAIDKVSATLASYNQGASNESQLKADYDNTVSLLNKNGKLAMEKINASINLTKAPFAISGNGYAYTASIGKYSQFFGNPTLGSIVDGQWKFNKSYDYLNGLLNSASCSI